MKTIQLQKRGQID